jgi:hypothetical protein
MHLWYSRHDFYVNKFPYGNFIYAGGGFNTVKEQIMKKMFFGVTVLLMVSLGLFIGCSKTEQPASRTTNEATVGTTAKEEVKSQAPIIIDDMQDFQFTPGYNVPGTIFQADFKWNGQEGRSVYLFGTVSGMYNLEEVPRRFDFMKEDIVTVVFKVQNRPSNRYFDFVSIEKK